MDAGNLRNLITFMAPTSAQDSTGETTQSWADVTGDVWAEIKPLSGRQLALAQANTITSTATHQISLWYRSAIRNKVNYKIRNIDSDVEGVALTRYFRINSIQDVDGEHIEMRLMVTEVVA